MAAPLFATGGVTEDEAKERWRNGRLLGASDGSGDFPREERLRRRGYALYYGEDHP